jgi:hypothetical protein
MTLISAASALLRASARRVVRTPLQPRRRREITILGLAALCLCRWRCRRSCQTGHEPTPQRIASRCRDDRDGRGGMLGREWCESSSCHNDTNLDGLGPRPSQASVKADSLCNDARRRSFPVPPPSCSRGDAARLPVLSAHRISLLHCRRVPGPSQLGVFAVSKSVGRAEHVERRFSSAPCPRLRWQTRLETAAAGGTRFPSVNALLEFLHTQGQGQPW